MFENVSFNNEEEEEKEMPKDVDQLHSFIEHLFLYLRDVAGDLVYEWHP